MSAGGKAMTGQSAASGILEAVSGVWLCFALERVMHVERSARCMDVEMKCHPGVRRDPDPGDCLDSRVRGNDHHAANTVY
jgi:hypothetical protein